MHNYLPFQGSQYASVWRSCFISQTYTQARATSRTSRPPPLTLMVISFKKPHARLASFPSVGGLRRHLKLSSDNLQMFNAINNSHYICFHPDVKRKLLEMMPNLKCKSCKFPSAECLKNWLQLSLMNERSWSGQIFYRLDFISFLIVNKLTSIAVYSPRLSACVPLHILFNYLLALVSHFWKKLSTL